MANSNPWSRCPKSMHPAYGRRAPARWHGRHTIPSNKPGPQISFEQLTTRNLKQTWGDSNFLPLQGLYLWVVFKLSERTPKSDFSSESESEDEGSFRSEEEDNEFYLRVARDWWQEEEFQAGRESGWA